uniref:Dihydroorotate dehydrogenase (quinone), mitochondrial n=1 Tax=Octopus bimaculoides TaxID=37653 RepID=A0A0L8IIA5_OCTBM|eukprot:XP_014785338.1 PREDICTED: dihydroorotate dehydrogenase (quinone), mitochondrial-like [Octopus bimaculoides]
MVSSQWTHVIKQLREVAVIVTGGMICFSGISLYQGNEKFYRQFVMPAVKILSPENAHRLGVALAKYQLFGRSSVADPAILKTKVWDLEFRNPVGVAAGFDKHGEAVDGLLKIGFGFVEVGSITPKPQPGNPKPRVFRLDEDCAVINRYGFNSDGHEVVYNRLMERNKKTVKINTLIDDSRNMLNLNFWADKFNSFTFQHKEPGILGINLGKNKTSENSEQDYASGVSLFGQLADFLVVNISSPNTPGLRNLQGRENLEKLIDRALLERDQLKCERKPPILVKIAPDLTESDRQDIARVVMREHSLVDGLIISNTTVYRDKSLISKNRKETGGLSGVPLREMSTQILSDMYSLTQGKIPIIGVGGISSGKDAYDKIRAGASLVELYTVMTYQGPVVVNRIKRELAELLQKDGYSSVSDAVGADHRSSQ